MQRATPLLPAGLWPPTDYQEEGPGEAQTPASLPRASWLRAASPACRPRAAGNTASSPGSPSAGCPREPSSPSAAQRGGRTYTGEQGCWRTDGATGGGGCRATSPPPPRATPPPPPHPRQPHLFPCWPVQEARLHTSTTILSLAGPLAVELSCLPGGYGEALRGSAPYFKWFRLLFTWIPGTARKRRQGGQRPREPLGVTTSRDPAAEMVRPGDTPSPHLRGLGGVLSPAQLGGATPQPQSHSNPPPTTTTTSQTNLSGSGSPPAGRSPGSRRRRCSRSLAPCPGRPCRRRSGGSHRNTSPSARSAGGREARTQGGHQLTPPKATAAGHWDSPGDQGVRELRLLPRAGEDSRSPASSPAASRQEGEGGAKGQPRAEATVGETHAHDKALGPPAAAAGAEEGGRAER